MAAAASWAVGGEGEAAAAAAEPEGKAEGSGGGDAPLPCPEEAGGGGDAGPAPAGSDGAGAIPPGQPRVLMMGLRRSGKSSIRTVVFHKMAPEETQELESTARVVKEDTSIVSFVGFQIWDFPGQLDFLDPAFDLEAIFGGAGTLIYVIDAQNRAWKGDIMPCLKKKSWISKACIILIFSDLIKDDYLEALTMLHLAVSKAHEINPDMNFEVFIHKVDGLSDARKIETQVYIREQAVDNLESAGLEKLRLSFYLTSIYDYSIFEAFSKVVQKLIPQLPTLENLLNLFTLSSGIEKAFLMDVASKIYVATDSSPVDMQSYGLCCDMLDMLTGLSCVYGLKEECSGSAYDEESMAVIRLNNRSVLYLRAVTKFLALACIVKEKNFERKGVIDYNFQCIRKAIQEVFEVSVPSDRSPEHQAVAPLLKAEAESDTPGAAL